MKDVIDLLLQKKATLDADKEAEKALACEKIDAEYAERSDKIDELLTTAGYVPPVVEEVPDEGEPVAEVADEAAQVETPAGENTIKAY
jgi:hypothetical protein